MRGEIVSISDDALELRLDGGPRALFVLAERLRESGLYEEAVPGIGAVAVRFDPLCVTREAAAAGIEAAAACPEEIAAAPRCHEIGVLYGGEAGPDLPVASAQLGLSEDEVVARHAAIAHEVVLLGFTPGFAYLDGAKALALPRLSAPRVRVPAGSVGLAGGRTGLYALAGPGGWPLIGRTGASLWEGEGPRLLPGDRVRFVPE